MNRKIKVMHLIWSMGDGGAQQVVLNYLRDFRDDPDIELKLFVFNKATDSSYNRIIKENDYNVEYLNYPLSRIRIPIIRFPFNRRVARKAWRKAIQEYQPDIVHVHISELLNVTLQPIVKEKIPVRFDTLHSNPKRYKGLTLRRIKRAFLYENVIPICLTGEQAEIAKEHYGIAKYEILHNGMDFAQIRSQRISKEQARKSLGISEDSFVVLGVGRLSAIKNFPLLINAFNIVAKEVPNAVLAIAGEGEERERLKELVCNLGLKDRVYFLGYQDNMPAVYCAADVLGMTSFSEASPLVLLEAQALEVRCVISSGVPDESIITSRVCKMPVNAALEQWADALADRNYQGKKVCDEEEYEVHAVSQKLKRMYFEYWRKYEQKE